MTLSMSQLTQPALERGLTILSQLLAKAERQRAELKLDAEGLLHSRLHPDMYPLLRQIQLASDTAKGAVARLSGTENPSMPDTEKTVAELQHRIAQTIAFIRSVAPEAIDGAETRTIERTAGGQVTRSSGTTYLLEFVLPNFYFHLTTAYALMRQAGVEIGKRDYLGLT